MLNLLSLRYKQEHSSHQGHDIQRVQTLWKTVKVQQRDFLHFSETRGFSQSQHQRIENV
jgi:hypothetical protein